MALSFFSNITLRKAFNQWLTWAQERQEYGTKLHLAVQVTNPFFCFVSCARRMSCRQQTGSARMGLTLSVR